MADNPKIQLLKREVRGAIEKFELAFHIAWSDTRARYRRSVLGPFWLVLGTLIGVGGLGFVWGSLFDVDRETFIPSLSIGLVTWYLLSGTITDSASVFFASRNLLLNIPVSSLLVALLLILRQLINFAHNFVVVILVMVIYPQHISPTALIAIPAIALVSFNLLAIAQLIGYVGARYRDLAPLLNAIMQPLFFLTPVLFRPSQLGTNAFITELNPLSYWLSLVREPLMGTAPSLSNWLVVIGMSIVCWIAAFAITLAKRSRLAYWVN